MPLVPSLTPIPRPEKGPPLPPDAVGLAACAAEAAGAKRSSELDEELEDDEELATLARSA
jgi:hypothetical protein